MKDFRDLQVWLKAHELALDVYRASAGFSAGEVKRMLTALIKTLTADSWWLKAENASC